jgi:integrase
MAWPSLGDGFSSCDGLGGQEMAILTKRTVDAAKADVKSKIIWDDELRGFGLLVLPSGVKSFVVQYRNATGRSRRLTIGRYGVLTPDGARKQAQGVLAKVAGGADPAADRQALRAAPTVSELLKRYFSEHVQVHNGPRYAMEVKRLVRLYIEPRLGTLKVNSVTRRDVGDLHRAMADIPRSANYALAVISKVFNLAEGWGMRPEHTNPTGHIKRYKENARERFLSDAELARLGKVLVKAETEGLPWALPTDPEKQKHLRKDADKRRTLVNPMALAAIRLLLFTGARMSEILELRWEHVDTAAGTLALPARKGDSRKAHPVSTGALAAISELVPVQGSPWVLPRGDDPTKHLSRDVLQTVWRKVRKRAEIADVRLHDLRHTVGTYAGQTNAGAFLIGHLLRHSNLAMTSRYVNEDADPIRALSNAVGDRVAAGLEGGTSGEVVPLAVIKNG